MPSQRATTAYVQYLLDASVTAARTAAEWIRSHAAGAPELDWRVKRTADFVTEVDTGAESRIRDLLLAAAPGAAIVGEELSPTGSLDGEVTFVVDPLDGTTNFLHGYPAYAVSIGTLVDGILAAGVVLDVPRDELFTATAGHGARRNGEPIGVSRIADPGRSLIGTGFPFKHLELLEEFQRQFAAVTRGSAGIRRAGSAALDLAAVACGRFDAFWELHLAPWDIAAGILLVREAGGQVTDIRGTSLTPSHSSIVASNALLHEWILTTLQTA